MSAVRKHLSGCFLDKLHINNSLEDPSYIREALCATILHVVGFPHYKVTHGTLTINSRTTGLVVIVEGSSKFWLNEAFGDDGGRLYDSALGNDVDEHPELIEGDRTMDRGDLRAIVNAVATEDAELRWNSLSTSLDTLAFARFLSMEVLFDAWDGYALGQNNYRVYFPSHSKAQFLCRGLDQAFCDHQSAILPRWKGKVAR
jgi:spore coat protein H